MKEAPSRLRQPLLDAAFDYLSEDNLGDPQQWIGRIALLPEASRAKGVESVARAWAQQNPEESVAWCSSLPAGEARSAAVGAISATWATKDPGGAGEWVGSMSAGPERDRGAESLAGALAEARPEESWAWIQSIADPGERTRAVTRAAATLARRNPTGARQWINTGPFTPEERAQIQAGVDLANRAPHRY
jgi:hypothetical protein